VVIKYVITTFTLEGPVEDFDAVRNYFYRRQAKFMSERASSVHLVVEHVTSHRQHFVFPGTDTLATIQVDDQPVGHVDFGINPLHDRVYINMIDIQRPYQRQGIGMSVLWQLWLMHQVPIVPLHEYGSSIGFWNLARSRFAAAGALIEPELRISQLDEAKKRWHHLVPESSIDRKIREYWEGVESEHAAGRPAGPGFQ
jgi:hypothetical protein